MIPAGLELIPDFITPGEELDLLAAVDHSPWRTDLQRRTQHYGYVYDYTRKTVDRSMYLGPLPDWTHDLQARMISLFDPAPDQLIVNEYQPGQGITRHTDCVPCFGPTVVSLSLGSATVMEFARRYYPAPADLELRLPPRSLLVLSGEARSRWMHAIAARTHDGPLGEAVARIRRVSLTFRTVILRP